MTETRRQSIVASCHDRIDNLRWFDEIGLMQIISQSGHDKGVIKHALEFAYQAHETEEQEAYLDG